MAIRPLRIATWNDTRRDDGVSFAVEAERLGAVSLWSPEAWGYDAFTPLAFVAPQTTTIALGTAIAQLGARTPAMLAMSAMSMQALTGGRFILGLGTSGPQVMEGWHGVEFTSPIKRTRETIDIVRAVARGDKVEYDGKVYRLPLPGGAGKPLRSMAPPVDVPIYLASLGPANLRLTGEVADGWIGNSFIPESAEVFLEPMREGAERVGRSLDALELTVAVAFELTDDVDEAARRHAAGYAFTFGAMGSKEHNFYNDAFARQGYGEAVEAVQRLWKEGKRDQAREHVPPELGLKTNLVGTPAMVKARMRLYRRSGISTLRVGLPGDDLTGRLDALAAAIDLADEVNREDDQ